MVTKVKYGQEAVIQPPERAKEGLMTSPGIKRTTRRKGNRITSRLERSNS